MSPLLSLALAGMAGIGLGVFYFVGLWLTVKRLPDSRWPVALLLVSFVARTAVVVVGFYFVMGGRWERVIVAVVGFIMARMFVVSRLLTEQASHVPGGKEVA